MLKIIVTLFIISSYTFSQNDIHSALESFNEITQHSDERIDQLLSREIRDSSDYSFDHYLGMINKLHNDINLLTSKQKSADLSSAILNEFTFRTIIAVQQNLERLYWQMPDMEKYKSSVVFATTSRELSQLKTGILNNHLDLLSSSNNAKLKQRAWLALERMLREIDVPLSESGNQFVQRSPYGLILRKGELTNKLNLLAQNESDADLKINFSGIINSVLVSGKYKDPGRPIVIGAGPEITDLINKEALLYFNEALRQNDHMQKIGYYSRAIKSDSNFAAAYFNRAASYFESENYSAAIQDFQQVLKLDPKQEDVYPRLGDTFLKTDSYKSAIEYYTKALQSELDETAKKTILISRGVAFEKLHQYKPAIKDFTEAIKLDSTSVTAYNNRVQCFVALKDYNKAIDDYETLIKLLPQNSTYYFNLGCIYWEHKNWQKVNEIWEKGLAVNPNDQNILKNLPEIKSKLSNP